MFSFFFFFNDTATTEIYTLSLHDALPISCGPCSPQRWSCCSAAPTGTCPGGPPGRTSAADGDSAAEGDRKSTRLNSSHANISYAVFCLKKKKNHQHSKLAPTLADRSLKAT